MNAPGRLVESARGPWQSLTSCPASQSLLGLSVSQRWAHSRRECFVLFLSQGWAGPRVMS